MGRHDKALGSLDRGDLDDVVPRRTGTVSEIDCEPEEMRRCEMNLSGRASETSQWPAEQSATSNCAAYYCTRTSHVNRPGLSCSEPWGCVFCFRLFRLTMASMDGEHGDAHVRLQSAAAGGTMDCFSEAPHNGAEVRCSKPDQTAAQFVCPGRGRPMKSQVRGRGDTPVARDRNTRNLGCDSIRFCIRLQQSSTSCRHDAARAQIQGLQTASRLATRHEGYCHRWRLILLAADGQHSPGCGRGGRANQVKVVDLTGFK